MRVSKIRVMCKWYFHGVCFLTESEDAARRSGDSRAVLWNSECEEIFIFCVCVPFTFSIKKLSSKSFAAFFSHVYIQNTTHLMYFSSFDRK